MVSKKKEENSEPKIRVKIKAYDYKVCDSSCKQIVETVKQYGGKIVGPIPLPTEIRRYTVNRSTFVHKDAREQFEIRIHKRIMDILNPSEKIIEVLRSLELPAGISIEVKTLL